MRKNIELSRRSMLLGFGAAAYATPALPTSLVQSAKKYSVTDHFPLPKIFLERHASTPTGLEDINYLVKNKTALVTNAQTMSQIMGRVKANNNQPYEVIQPILEESYKTSIAMQATLVLIPRSDVFDRFSYLYIGEEYLGLIRAENEMSHIVASIMLSNEASHAIQISEYIFDYLLTSPDRGICAQVELATELCSDCRSMVQAYELTNGNSDKIKEIALNPLIESSGFSSSLSAMATAIKSGASKKDAVLAAINHLWSADDNIVRQNYYINEGIKEANGQPIDPNETLSAESFVVMNKSAGLDGFLEIFWPRLAPALLSLQALQNGASQPSAPTIKPPTNQ
jgi:hypothetical protein